ncbi:C40 family peptidase [Ructibacterium gallinarum]|uniref:C40 family peptidase n=1 Tax=Ructibacterium gallinarum TaxID=2779355 RepID=A0A9D5RA76_9FIRM|nr:NlpC/P60 family protein [Ructibacterium gallinarum]MBE5041214.1 C40 family peptidase [Ructibacterium gallinarum]
MSEKDIKVKPQTTTKSVKNAPKSMEHSAKTAAWDIKTVAKDTLVKNAIDKQLDIKHSEQPQRAEVEATEQVENTYYSAVDTVYQKGKSLAKNKVKQHQQQVKTKENADTPNTQKADISEVQNTPKQADNTPKTKESVKNTDSVPKTNNSVAQVKTKEAYINSQKSQKAENIADTVKTKQNYINAHKNAEIKQKPNVSTPKTRENTSVSSAPTPKTKEQAIKDARKKYVSEKLKTKAEAEKSASKNYTADIPKQNAELIKTETSVPKSDFTTDTAFSPKSMPKTKDNYIHSRGKTPFDLIKTPDRAKVIPKQNTHTVTRNVSNNTKQAVKTKDSLLKGTIKAVKTGNSYIGKSAKKKSVKTAKRAAKTQKEITKKAAKQAAKQAKEVAQKSAQAAKATAKAAVKITVKVAQMVAAAAKAIVSALAALGGWAVLLVALIVVIVVAAIAASPFGIFISDEAADNDSIPISAIVAECNMELSNKLDDIENAAAADRSEIIGEQANWDLVLAVFATKVAGVEDDTVQDVVVITEDKKQKLKDVFWDMHEITSRTETVTNGDTSEKVVYITITTKTKDDMISKYNFTRKQQEALNTLLEQDEVLISATHSLAVSDATAQDILKNLPESLSAERKKVIKAACSLVGKVNYFWGGKSSAIGWDSEWGKLKTVSSEGSKTTGTKRPFGLDCSGFVTWSFINSGFSANSIGHGTQGQIAKCSRISWSSAQAGDLSFYGDLSHVGIIAGKDASGNILVIHCSSSNNNVVITTNSGFGFAARPSAY